MDFLGRRAQKGLTPPHTPTGIRGEGRGAIGVSAETARGQDKFQNLENRGEPLENIWSPGTGRGWTHASFTSTPLPTWTFSATAPYHARISFRVVDPTRGRGE